MQDKVNKPGLVLFERDGPPGWADKNQNWER